jgi:membrane-associated phospholipid phosphatase
LYTLSTPLDEAVPFIPEWEFVYVLCYVIPLVPIVVVRERSRLNQLIVAFIAMNAIAFAIFVLFPVYCPRPAFEVNSVATYLLSLEHAMDRPVNNFPSLHAAIAWLLFLGCRGYTRWNDFVMLVATIGISIAALCIKQHYLVDIIAGILLACGTYALVRRLHPLGARLRKTVFQGANNDGT